MTDLPFGIDQLGSARMKQYRQGAYERFAKHNLKVWDREVHDSNTTGMSHDRIRG